MMIVNCCFSLLLTPLVSKINSEYIEEYRKWPIEIDGDYGSKLGLKKSHFILGTDSMKDPYKSLYKRDHVKFDKIAASTLDVETLKDLRRHHFELGTFYLELQRFIFF